MNMSSVIRCQLPSETVKNEIDRIIRYMSAYPDEHLYVVDNRYGTVPYWSLTGVKTIREYYDCVIEKDGGNAQFSTCRESGAPVWMCVDEVITYMEEAGLVKVDGGMAYATPWLYEYGSRVIGV